MSNIKVKISTPVKSLRLKCLDCTSNQPGEIRCCEILDCPCWPYRMGRRPSQEELEMLKQHLERS